MSAVEPARHALYSRLEDVLGREHADTLMSHLPQHPSDEVATKGDLATLDMGIAARFDGVAGRFDGMADRFDGMADRFDRMEDRFNRMEDRFDRMESRFDRMEERLDRNQRFYVATTFGTLTAMTAIFSFVVSIPDLRRYQYSS